MYVCVFFVCIHCLPVFFSFYSNLTILLRIFAHIAVLHRNAFFAFLQSLNEQNTSAFHHFIDFDVWWLSLYYYWLTRFSRAIKTLILKKKHSFVKLSTILLFFFWPSFSIFGRTMNNSMCFILSCFLAWLPEPYDYPSWCVILVFSVHATGAAIFISEWLSPQGLNRGATPLRGNGEVNQAVRRGSTHFFFFSLFYHFSDSDSLRHEVHTERTHPGLHFLLN